MILKFCFYLYNKTTFIYIVPEFQISKQVEENSQNKKHTWLKKYLSDTTF